MYRFIYSSDVNGSASSLSSLHAHFMILSYRARTTRQSVPDRVPKRKKERDARRSRLSTHLHEPPPILQRHDASRSSHTRAHRSSPRFASAQTRSFLPSSSRALASPRSAPRRRPPRRSNEPNSTKLDQTRPPHRLDETRSTLASSTRRARRPIATPSRRPSRRSTLDSRQRLASASRESRLAARPQSCTCTRARRALDRSRSRSMKVDRWTSIAIDEK